MGDLGSVHAIVGVREEGLIEQEADRLGARHAGSGGAPVELGEHLVGKPDRHAVTDGWTTDTGHGMSIRRRKSREPTTLSGFCSGSRRQNVGIH